MRVTMISSFVAAAAISLAAAQAQAPASPNWPQFRNTPTLTGVAGTPLPASLKQLWTYDAGGAVENRHVLKGDPELIGEHLRERRLVALPVR